MTESAILFAAVIFGVVMTVVFLGLGLWVGYQLGRASPTPANRALSEQVERLTQELASCAKLGNRAAEQVEQLNAAGGSTRMPRDMMVTLQQLLATTKSLSQRLQEAGTSSNTASLSTDLKPINPDTPTGRPSDLSAEELGQFTETPQAHDESDNLANRRRYPYDCLQHIVEWDDPNGPLPSPTDAAVVRCHDVSMQGVSFFWPDDPHFKFLLISLGNDNKMVFMAAEVVRSKPVFMHGEWQCVVSCRFSQRVPAFTEEWKLQAAMA